MSNDNKDNFSTADFSSVALNDDDRAGLVIALKDKLQTLTGHHSDILDKLTPTVRKRVEVLREIQSQHDELEAKFFEERAALEAKYQKLYQPLYAKRYDIVNGVIEVEGTPDECTMDQEGDKAAEEKGVPDFWLTAMKNNVVLAEKISKRDEGALKYLKDIKWCRVADPKGFKLEFIFEPNPYFKNSVLTKTYQMIDEYDPILEKAFGTEIEWYPGMCLTQKVLKKKPKNAKPITKNEYCESFFNFFNPPKVPEDDEDIDDDAAEDLQNQMEEDYDVGSTIRDKVISHAVSWYTGETIQGEDMELDDDDDDDIDEDYHDEENNDEDDDDEGEDESKPRKKRSGRILVGDGQQQQGERPPECKQQ